MSDKVLIFGKNGWPFTIAAREAYAKKNKDLEYIDVLSDPDKLSSMMKYSNGMRKVPIIVEGDKVSIGFNGRSWGVW